MAARGIMVPAVFTAVPGTIMALVCPLLITIIMARGGALALARAQAVSGGRPGLRVPRAITMAAVAAGVAASSRFSLCL